ncbi:MAG: hypothetical protein QOF33_537 [Thermomicrobiales bacterium]|jgi:hypothetical protein|nr:hypothetical protein [Thermomicrobiales bacterium]
MVRTEHWIVVAINVASGLSIMLRGAAVFLQTCRGWRLGTPRQSTANLNAHARPTAATDEMWTRQKLWSGSYERAPFGLKPAVLISSSIQTIPSVFVAFLVVDVIVEDAFSAHKPSGS